MKSVVIISKEVQGVPSEFQVFPLGQIDLEGDPAAILDQGGIDQIVADFERRGNDMVIDYEHQTLKDGEAPAAGWIKKLINRGKEGLWAAVEWTKQARQHLAKREYRYFSPVFWVQNQSRRVIKIEHMALTNFPKINQLKPIVAKNSFDAGVLEVAKMFGNTPEDLIKYGGDPADSHLDENDSKELVLSVAKLFGNTPEDIQKYGA